MQDQPTPQAVAGDIQAYYDRETGRGAIQVTGRTNYADAAFTSDPWEGLSFDDRMLHPDWQLARIRGRLIDAGNALAVQYLLEARMRMAADEQTAARGDYVAPIVGMAMRHNWLRTRALSMPDPRFLSPWVRWML